MTDRATAHRIIKDTLGFPDWYGNNLDALLDCLTDISRPTHIAFIRMRDEGPLARWFDKLALALMIAARENPSIDIEIFFATSEQSSR